MRLNSYNLPKLYKQTLCYTQATAACMIRRAIGKGPLSEVMMLQNLNIHKLIYTSQSTQPPFKLFSDASLLCAGILQ